MLVFRKILRTYLMDDPLTYLQILVGHILKPSFLAIFFPSTWKIHNSR